MNQAWSSLARPSTKSELSKKFAIDSNAVAIKTVENRLGKVHNEIRNRRSQRGKQHAFVVLDDVNTGVRRYAVMPRSVRQSNTITFNGRKYGRSSRKRLNSGYAAEIFERD